MRLKDRLLMVRSRKPERRIERELTRYCSDNDILWIKQKSPIGIPDRLLVLPNGRVLWVELKTTEGTLKKAQTYFHRRLRTLQHEVYTIRSTQAGINLIAAKMGSSSLSREGPAPAAA